MSQEDESNVGCCGSCCSCFSSKKYKETEHDIREKWKQKWRQMQSLFHFGSTPVEDLPFKLLLRLYAHEDVVPRLARLKTTPFLSSEQRDDLEFYVPQLCNFILHGRFEQHEDLETFLLQKCQESVYFAHRVLWNLAANGTDAHAVKLKLAVEAQGCGAFREQVFDVSSVYNASLHDYSSPVSARRLEERKEEEGVQVSMDDIETVLREHVAEGPDRFLLNRHHHGVNPTVPRLSPNGFDEFLATPFFVQRLTEIAQKLRLRRPDQRVAVVTTEIASLNSFLPSPVYVPFVGGNSNRHHLVLRVVPQDVVVFNTNTRAPYMIYLEVLLKERKPKRKEGLTEEVQAVLKKMWPFKKEARKPDLTPARPNFDNHRDHLISPGFTPLLTHPRPPRSPADFHLPPPSGSDRIRSPSFDSLSSTHSNTVSNRTAVSLPVEPMSRLYDEPPSIPQSYAESHLNSDINSASFATAFEGLPPSPFSSFSSDAQTSISIPIRDRRSSADRKRASVATDMDTIPESPDGSTHESPLKTQHKDPAYDLSAAGNGLNGRDIIQQVEDNEDMSMASGALSPSPSPSPVPSTVNGPVTSVSNSFSDGQQSSSASTTLPSTSQDRSQSENNGCIVININTVPPVVDDSPPQIRDDSVSRMSNDEWAEEHRFQSIVTAEGEEDHWSPTSPDPLIQNSGQAVVQRAVQAGPAVEQHPPIRRRNSFDEVRLNEGIHNLSRKIFGESSQEAEHRLRSLSPYGHLENWRLVRLLVKSGDDLRQEQFAVQLISQFEQIFKEANLRLWLRSYEIVATSPDSGLIEAIPDAISLDSLKRRMGAGWTTLHDFFCWNFGGRNSGQFKQARKNFVESLAAYSIVCYLLQIKDRHNGNIMLDREGHIIHIDFGFMLSNSPGKGINFENVPFKLTSEFVDVMGGPRSETFNRYRSLCIRGYWAARKQAEKIMILVEMMRTGTNLPCFAAGDATIDALRSRFHPFPNMTKAKCVDFVNDLIDRSLDNWRTRWYDKYQRCCQGIF